MDLIPNYESYDQLTVIANAAVIPTVLGTELPKSINDPELKRIEN